MTTIKRILKRAARLVAAVIAAGAINALLFSAIAALNATAQPKQKESAQTTMRYLLQQPQPHPPEPEQQPAPEEQTQQRPKKLAAEVRPPEPASMQSTPMPLALDLPPQRISPVQVATPPRQTRAPSPSQRQAQQKNRTRAQRETSNGSQREQRGVSRGPRLIRKPRLQYDAHGFAETRQGRVLIRFTINRQGRVQEAELIRVEQGPKAMGEALMEVIDQFRFTPARRDGDAVTYTQRMRINVVLQ